MRQAIIADIVLRELDRRRTFLDEDGSARFIGEGETDQPAPGVEIVENGLCLLPKGAYRPAIERGDTFEEFGQDRQVGLEKSIQGIKYSLSFEIHPEIIVRIHPAGTFADPAPEDLRVVPGTHDDVGPAIF